jgi:CRISPR-associated endonuclease/helicase Cas3
VIRARLAAGLPCRLVSTQVVEAGVDLDFPLVLRALGPLDRIVQAAGRCNREGKLETGRVVVFRPEEGGMPPGPYRTAATLTEMLLARGGLDPDDPATFEHYFRRLFGVSDLDPNRIQRSRAALQYREVADAFRMIEDDTASVLVRYRRRPGLFDGLEIDPKLKATDHEAAAKALLVELRKAAAGQGAGRARRVLARAQPYLVSVRRREIERAQGEGLATELVGDVWEWHGGYDDAVGLTWQGRGADELVI